jgi:hypothetical protein
MPDPNPLIAPRTQELLGLCDLGELLLGDLLPVGKAA